MENWETMDMKESWLPFEEGWASVSSPTLHPVTRKNIDYEDEPDRENASNPLSKQSKLSRKQLASKWLKELEQSHLEDDNIEPFSGWLGEKMDLEVFRDVATVTYPSTMLLDDESSYSFPLTAPSSPESNGPLLSTAVTPPESPSLYCSGFVMIPVDNKNLLANFEHLLQSVEEFAPEAAHEEVQCLPTPPLSPPLETENETLFDVLLEGEVCCFGNESEDTSFIDDLIEEAVSPVSTPQPAFSSPSSVPHSTVSLADLSPVSPYAEGSCPSPSFSVSSSSSSSSSSSDEDFVVDKNKRGKATRKTNSQRGVSNGGVSKRSSSSGKKRLPEDRKMRKKEQNKTAATRYRLKKKAEVEELLGQENELVKTNRALKKKFEGLAGEVRYLKKLMREMFTAKGLMS